MVGCVLPPVHTQKHAEFAGVGFMRKRNDIQISLAVPDIPEQQSSHVLESHGGVIVVNISTSFQERSHEEILCGVCRLLLLCPCLTDLYPSFGSSKLKSLMSVLERLHKAASTVCLLRPTSVCSGPLLKVLQSYPISPKRLSTGGTTATNHCCKIAEGFEQLNRFILSTSAVRPQCFLPSDHGARAVYSTGHRVNVTRFS
jgi:hypothetical protein